MALPDSIPDLGPRDDRPRPKTGLNLANVPLTPTEGFVLSQVDGRTSYEQICRLTGLGESATLEILRKLKREGLILGPEPTGEAPKRRTTAIIVGENLPPSKALADQRRRSTPIMDPVLLVGPSLLERHDDGSPVLASLLAQGPDLDELMKVRLVRLHRRLKNLGPRELLGVTSDADIVETKRVYFIASKELHPDRYFGKDLGPFKEMLSDIFGALSRAFEDLVKGRVK